MNEYLNWGYEIFTWKTQAKQEVDLILYGEKGIHAIEVKRSQKIRSEDLQSLILFKNDYPMAKLHLVYGENEKQIIDQIAIWPIENFLKNTKEIFE